MTGRHPFTIRTSAILPLLLMVLAGCAGVGAGGNRSDRAIDDYLGIYRGSFVDALTEDPADDLNYNPCDPGHERCLGGDEPLADIRFELARDAAGRVRLTFLRTVGDRDVPLDLLGPGCTTGIEGMREFRRDPGSGRWIATFPITAGNRLCLNKLRPTSVHEIRVELGNEPATGVPVATVRIDRDVKSENYLYVVEGGVRRRVRVDLDNTMVAGPERRYRVCIEDDLGEYQRCVLTDRELKKVLLPVPLPGGGAVSYTWWHELTPDLKRTRGLYRLEQYSGDFKRIAPARERD